MILASNSRDVLATPISTVSSESAFSMEAEFCRVLNEYKSYLHPKIVEILMCL